MYDIFYVKFCKFSLLSQWQHFFPPTLHLTSIHCFTNGLPSEFSLNSPLMQLPCYLPKTRSLLWWFFLFVCLKTSFFLIEILPLPPASPQLCPSQHPISSQLPCLELWFWDNGKCLFLHLSSYPTLILFTVSSSPAHPLNEDYCVDCVWLYLLTLSNILD